MLPDRVSNPGPLTYESGALPIAPRGPARAIVYNIDRPRAMNAEATVASQNYRITLYIVG